MTKRKIYLDYNATTPLRGDVLEAMLPYLRDTFGNASSMHGYGQEAKKALEDARETVARLLGAARTDEIVFTGSGTESDNTAVKGVAWANRERGNHIVTSQVEHHAVLYTCQYLERRGFSVTYLPVDGACRVDPADVQKALRPETILVTIMHGNNEVGTVEPIDEIGKVLARENARRRAAGAKPVYFHADAVQTAGKIPLNVRKLGVDLLSLSAHKFYGPKGVGALYVKAGTVIEPLLHGGHHELNRRAGTENVAGIVGLAAALDLELAHGAAEQKRLLALRVKLENGITANIPGVVINGHPAERLAGTLNVSFKYIEGESLLLTLDLEGISASTGSACASGSSEPSHVLKAMCVAPDVAQGTLRFSLGHMTTDDDVARVLEVLPRVVSRLREMSPLWKECRPAE